MAGFANLAGMIVAHICCLAPLHAAVLPAGSELEVRLLDRVGSHGSHVGDLVQAVTIAPVFDHKTILLSAGATVSGIVEQVHRLGLGLRHTAARLDLQFTRLNQSDGTIVPIDAHLVFVEEARETVSRGAVIGIHPGASFSTGVSLVFTLFCFGAPQFGLPVLAFKFLAARSPDAEIAFPAGTELILRLSRDVQLHDPATDEPTVESLTASQSTQLRNILATLREQQTSGVNKQPSDLINIVLLGSKPAIDSAFRAAGWNGTERHGVMALYHMYHCVVERVGYSMAPMATLKLNGSPPDAAFQKGLNTLSKRHHVRFWHGEQSDIWLGAATEDIRYQIRGMRITHETDRNIDNERAKVVNDLAFTGCIARGALVPRPSLIPIGNQAHSILTDGDIAVLQLNACNDPLAMQSALPVPTRVRGTRATLAVTKDIIRSNPVSVGYAFFKSAFDGSSTREPQRVRESGQYTRAIAVPNISEPNSSQTLASR